MEDEKKTTDLVAQLARDVPATPEDLKTLVGADQSAGLIDQLVTAIYANISKEAFNDLIKTTSNDDAVEGHTLADSIRMAEIARDWAVENAMEPLASTPLWEIKTKLTFALKRTKLDRKSRMERARADMSAAANAAE